MKQTFAKVGMAVSILILIMGILVIAGALGGETSYASSAPYSYDSGYASFGADFYSYVSNNAQEAAVASRIAASNVAHMSDLLKNFCGILLMGLGAISFCAFGIALGGMKKEELKATEAIGGVCLITSAEEEAPAVEENPVVVTTGEELVVEDTPTEELAAEEGPVTEETPAEGAVAAEAEDVQE